MEIKKEILDELIKGCESVIVNWIRSSAKGVSRHLFQWSTAEIRFPAGNMTMIGLKELLQTAIFSSFAQLAALTRTE